MISLRPTSFQNAQHLGRSLEVAALFFAYTGLGALMFLSVHGDSNVK